MRSSTMTGIRRTGRAILLTLLAATIIAATKGPDAGGYTASDSVVYSLADLSLGSGGASVLAGVDDGLAALTIPFTFQFYGRAYTVVCASSNGALYFVNAA